VVTDAKGVRPLFPGARLRRDEFLRRCEAMPEVKKAELIGELVYMQGASSFSTGKRMRTFVAGCTAIRCVYQGAKTWLMLEDAPQPDVHLLIRPDFGGQSYIRDDYHAGAPELAAEVCLSRMDYDLHQKLALYQSAGVQEYVTILLAEQEARWHRLVRGNYELMRPSPDGSLRSQVFPGLWLKPEALLTGNSAKVYEPLQLGLQSAEHADFVRLLASRKQSSG